MSVLSRSDLAFFEENGYVVARNVVPPELLEPVIAAVWAFLGMNPDDPETWYPETPRIGGIVHIHQHQALWNTRQHPPVHAAFADIYGTEKLWVSMDRASMKPPYNPKYPAHDDKGFIHWDLDTTQLPTELFVQGVLYLTDTTEEMGGFQCVPGFHRDLGTWIRQQPPDRNSRQPDLSRLPEGMKVTPVPGKAGDLVIWNTLLAHGNGHNVSDRPRLAQYITMYPAKESDDESRQERIACWQERRPPKWWPGDPRQREQQFGQTAELTPLGRKLLGLDLW